MFQYAVGGLFLLAAVLIIFGLVAFIRGVNGGDAQGGWGQFQISLPGALFVVALGVASALFGTYLLPREGHVAVESPGASPSQSVAAALPQWSGLTTPARVPAEAFTLTSPEDDEHVTGRKGVLMAGTTGPLADARLWIMVISGGASGGQVYYLSSDALAPVDGNWSATIAPIGAGESDVGATFTVVVVRADQSCTAVISATKPNSDGDIVFEKLPKGCIEVGRRHVIKTAA